MKVEWKIENLLPAAIAGSVTLIMLWIITLYEVFTTGNFGITGIIFLYS